ncbi:MAG: DUF6178 family protein [Desulfuromonadales bacterium]
MSIKPTSPTVGQHEFSSLSFAEQIDVLRCQDARQKSRLLIDAANGAELIAQLSAQEVYLMAMERGPEHLPELLSLATPEQWTGFIDLDCWDGDEFAAARAHRWLATLMESDEETVFKVLRTMNFELLTLILKTELEIISGPEATKDDDARAETVKREGGYEINYRSENGAKLYGRLLEILQDQEAEFFVYLLEAVRAETMIMIEESVYQQRTGRLLDMGIPEPFAAQKVYSWLDPELYKAKRPFKLAPGSFAASAPGFILNLVRPKGILAEVLAEGLDEELAWEMANVTNKVMMADRIEMGDLDQVRAVIGKVDAYLNLALEWLAGQDLALARQSLDERYCEDLFRLGYSLTLKLQRRAAALCRTSVAPYLDPNAKACLAALAQNPPLYFEGVGDPTRGGARWFAGLFEVSAVEQWLEKIEVQQQIFEEGLQFALPDPAMLDLNGCQPDDIEDITLVEFFLTALSNKLLGRDFQPLPLAEEELAGLHGMVAQSGVLHPRLREETVNWLESLVPGGGDFARYCLDIWEEEFCSIGFEDIDPRYIGGLIVRLGGF